MYSRQKILEIARSKLGYGEANGKHKLIVDAYNRHTPLARGYKVRYTDAWCATFISAVAIEAGYTAIIPTECGCDAMIKLFQKMGCWVENDAYTPKPADVIFYDWQDSGAGDCKGSADHVGYVESVSNGVITVLEGNISDKVGRRTIKVNGRYIRGYGVPHYDATTTKKTVAEVAQEVIAGKWGNGDVRRAAIEKAGYSFAEVQNAVNAILTGKKKKSLETIAREVIAGKWGNGTVRKNALEKAGYDYLAVQNAVNKLLT